MILLNNTTPASAFINASPYRARASRPRLSPPQLRRGAFGLQDCVNLGDAATMPLFGQFGRQPDADDVAHLLFRDHLAAERQHIRAIMFAAVSCRAFVVTHRRSNTRDFVGDHAGTDSVAV